MRSGVLGRISASIRFVFSSSLMPLERTSNSGSVRSGLPMTVDAAKLIVAANSLWFTVEHSPSGRLADALGKLDLATGAVAFVPGEARDVVARTDGIHTIASARQRIDPASLLATADINPPGVFDYSAGTFDANGNVVVRNAKMTQLTFADPRGHVVRTVPYSAGTFIDSSGQARSLAARLAFLGLDSSGGVWWGPLGGRSIFRVV